MYQKDIELIAETIDPESAELEQPVQSEVESKAFAYKKYREELFKNLESLKNLIRDTSSPRYFRGQEYTGTIKPEYKKWLRGSKFVIGTSFGTNIKDLADLCNQYQLGLDFSAVAKMYDYVRPNAMPEQIKRLAKIKKSEYQTKDIEKRSEEAGDLRQSATAAETKKYADRIQSQQWKVVEGSQIKKTRVFNIRGDESWQELVSNTTKQRLDFIDTVWESIVAYFNRRYPEQYDENTFKNIPTYYSTKSAKPLSIASMSKMTKVAEKAKEISGYDIYTGLIQSIETFIETLNSDIAKSTDQKASKEIILKNIVDNASALNNSASHYGVTINVEINKDIVIEASQIIKELEENLYLFINNLFINRVLPRYNVEAPKGANEEIIGKLVEDKCKEPMPQSKTEKRKQYKLNLILKQDGTPELDDIEVQSTAEELGPQEEEIIDEDEEVEFYTDINQDYSTFGEVIRCEFCSTDEEEVLHPDYPGKQSTWDDRLRTTLGKLPNEIITFRYTSEALNQDGSKTTKTNSVKIRRHELLERHNDLLESGKIQNYQIFPHDPDHSYYVLDNGRLSIKKVPEGKTLAQELSDMKRLQSRLNRSPKSNLSQENAKLLNIKFPDSPNDSLDIADRDAVRELESTLSYYDPYNNTTSSVNPDHSGISSLITKLTSEGELQNLALDQSKDSQLFINPESCTFREWIGVEGNELQVILPPHPEQERLESEGIGRKVSPKDGKTYLKVELDPKTNQQSVKFPWVYKKENFEINGEYAEPYEKNEKNEDTKIQKRTVLDKSIKAPLNDPSEVELTFYKKVKGAKEEEHKLQHGVNYELDGSTQFRKIIWVGGSLKDNNGKAIKLEKRDVIAVAYKGDSDMRFVYYEKIPVARAMEIAQDLWTGHIYEKEFSHRTTGEYHIETDENGRMWGREDGKPVSLMRLLKTISKSNKALEDFLEKHGNAVCSNLIRTDSGESECSQIADHASYPSVLVLKPGTKTCMGFGDGPDWKYVTKDYITAQKQVEIWTGKDEEKAAIAKRRLDALVQNMPASKSVVNPLGQHKFKDVITSNAYKLVGICDPCWYHHYDIIPKPIFNEMFNDLEIIRALSQRHLGGRTKHELSGETETYETKTEELKDNLFNISLKNGHTFENVKILETRKKEKDFIKNELLKIANNAGLNIAFFKIRQEKGTGPTEKLKFVVKNRIENEKLESVLSSLNVWHKQQTGVDLKHTITRKGPPPEVEIIYAKELGVHTIAIYKVEKEDGSISEIDGDSIHKRQPITQHRSGSELVLGKVKQYQIDSRTLIGTEAGVDEEDNHNIRLLNGNTEVLSDEEYKLAKIVAFDLELARSTIISLCEDFYANYISTKSFWFKIKEYLENDKSIVESRRDKAINVRKENIISQIISLQKSLMDDFQVLFNGYQSMDGQPLLDLGVDDGLDDSGNKIKDYMPSNMPWFTKQVVKLMHQVNHVYMWTEIIKRRYSGRDSSAEGDSFIRSMMSLTRKDARDRMALSQALGANYNTPPIRFGKSYNQEFNKFLLNNSYTPPDDKIMICEIKDAPYLSGLTGSISYKLDENRYIIKLDENTIVEDDRIVLNENEFTFISNAKIKKTNKKTITESIKPKIKKPKEATIEEIYMQGILKEMDDHRTDKEMIDIIGEFTPDYPSWG